MSGRTVKTSESSTSTLSARKRTKKTQTMPSKPGASPTIYGQGEVLSRPSSSPLAEVYRTKEFRNEWANNVQSHVARNLLHLRRYRRMSQARVGEAMGTSQSAIARIESAQENITLDTLQRLVVALDGRFYVSIVPQEYPAKQELPWWESINSMDASWNVVRCVTNRSAQADQVLLGLERPRGQYLSAAGTHAGGIVGLLEASTTR